ncbi:MAG: helix-turn-helix domain-containing protein [Lachnospiraceae bacterium]|nr:helix-turn-helix domain-containing protein [Lachnospiraceae bacterium]
MQYVGIYDKSGHVAEKIKAMSFWSIRNDFELIEVIQDEDEIYTYLDTKRPNIFLLVMEQNEVSSIEKLKQITNLFLGIKIIMIGYEKSYEVVRKIFLNAAFDYLIQPLDARQLEEALVRVYDMIGLGYVVNDLQMKIDALIDNIFLGGGQEEIIIQNMIDQIYEDWKRDAINCQVIADKAKNHIYEILIDRKPWLEKFLYRNDFTYKFGFSLMRKEDIIKEWARCFQEASKMVVKYQMIDDKLVYRIGKYVVVHVDEKLSLESVAEGVYLNPSYVSHIFKKTTGMNFTDYMAEVKVDRAKVLLRDSRMKIYDVASTVGYSDSEYFAKIFKKKTGYCPTSYQKMLEELYEKNK